MTTYAFQCPRCFMVSGHMSQDPQAVQTCCGGVRMAPYSIHHKAAVSDWMEQVEGRYDPSRDYRKRPKSDPYITETVAIHRTDKRGRGCVGKLMDK